ncbi:VWA domain-containing protein [Acidipila sp. EB88]|uniref:VWA domain-containing protein n=1 Tax=Acidipila sp. EB88 TaxID=2305226 RepID=UPI000F5D84A1|nr:VWA domain-containing protein [Acidipila sp. EB88]RRA47229.1 VWA domain-containing protein [Acidipila sp. EB88]
MLKDWMLKHREEQAQPSSAGERARRVAAVGWLLTAILCGVTLPSGAQAPATQPAQGAASSGVPVQPEPAVSAQSGVAAPQAGDATTTLRVSTELVLVPTLVAARDGSVVYGLGADAFTLTDNGVPQKIRVDEDLDTTPVSLVVCVEKGRSSGMQFEKFVRLAPLVSLFLGNGNGEVALVEFDSQINYQEFWTKDTDLLQNDLDQLEPGDGGAALLDAAAFSIDLLEKRPADRRRILLLVSESRDHGSKQVSAQQLVERIGTSNTLVLNLTWSPAKADALDALMHPGAGQFMNPVYLAQLAFNAMKSNAAKSLAVMSGGESMSFTGERGFEDRVSELASHARNRYMLSFHPTDPAPGIHKLQVELKGGVAGQVVARTDYWSGAAPSGEGSSKP